jgi:hypothetical protein
MLVLSVTAYKIVFNSAVELIPNPFDKKADYIDRKLSLTETPLNTLEISGRFMVKLIWSDSLFAFINGPDNLVNNYVVVEQNGNKMSVRSKIDLAKYYHPITIKFYINKLRMISLSRGAIVSMEKFESDSLNITLEDSAIFNAASSKFVQTNIVGKNKSMAMISKTKNASIHLYDESNLLLMLDGGEVSGTFGTKTDLGLEGSIKKNSVSRVQDGINRREK